MKEGLLSEDDFTEKGIERIERFFKNSSYHHDTKLDGKVVIEKDNDDLKAYLTLIPPQIGGRMVRWKDVELELMTHGIKDPNLEVIREALKKKVFNKKLLIANGVSPCPGKDSQILYNFLDLGCNEDVIPGQLLLAKLPPLRGRQGVSVAGGVIPAPLGNDIALQPGRNVLVSCDKLRYYAGDFGQVYVSGNRINVERIKVIKKNLCEEDGPIRHDGMIKVLGSVSRIRLEATGDIEIVGKVRGSTLVAGGAVVVEGGIFEATRITASGGLKCGGIIEGAFVESGGDVVSESILNSDVKAEGLVDVFSGRGVIRGGRIYSKLGVIAKEIGDSTRVNTFIKVSRGGRVSSLDGIFPGTKVVIFNHEFFPSHRETKVTLVLEGGEVRIVPFNLEGLEAKGETRGLESKEIDPSITPSSVVIRGKEGEDVIWIGSFLLDIEKDRLAQIPLSGSGEEVFFRVYPRDVKCGPWEGKKDGKFYFKNTRDGLLLCVSPPEGLGERVRVDSVLDHIREKGYLDADLSLVEKVVREASGKEVRIGPRQFDPELDGMCLVEIKEDGMVAEATLLPHKRYGIPLCYEDVLNVLRESGVVFGIRHEEIKSALEKGVFCTPFIVAEGRPPIGGRNAEIQYRVGLKPTRPQFTENELGRVDFRELNLFEVVQEGQVLCTKTPPVPSSEPGRKVTGEVVLPDKVLDIPLPRGLNTVVGEDGLSLLAAKSGHVSIREGKINIEPVLEVEDVGLETGNIKFPGTVLVKGNVSTGFKIEAEGDIYVQNNVEAATLTASGDILIGSGVKGRDRARLRAGGNIFSKFIEGAWIFSEQNVFVKKDLMHSVVLAKGRVCLYGRDGTILGGRVVAGCEVNTSIVGSEAGILTRVEVGVDPEIKMEMLKLEARVQKSRNGLERIRRRIADLKNRRGYWERQSAEDAKRMLYRLRNAQDVLLATIRDSTEKAIELEKTLFLKGGRICVKEVIFPGSEISIRSVSQQIKREFKFTTFFAEHGEIKIGTYEDISEELRDLIARRFMI